MTGHNQSSAPKPAPGPWADFANCLGLPPDWFFPARDDSQSVPAEAKKVCAACQVRQQCLDYAMTPPVITNGVWGGLSERERKRLRRKQRLERRASA